MTIALFVIGIIVAYTLLFKTGTKKEDKEPGTTPAPIPNITWDDVPGGFYLQFGVGYRLLSIWWIDKSIIEKRLGELPGFLKNFSVSYGNDKITYKATATEKNVKFEIKHFSFKGGKGFSGWVNIQSSTYMLTADDVKKAIEKGLDLIKKLKDGMVLWGKNDVRIWIKLIEK